MSFELVELSSANVVGFYDTEEAALNAVLESIERYGQASVATLALGYNDPHGPGYAIADGKALAERAIAGRQEKPAKHMRVPA
jgi:hypothetical protein